MSLSQQQRQWLRANGYRVHTVLRYTVVVERQGQQYAYSRHELQQMMRTSWVGRFKLWIAGVAQ